MGGAPGAGGPCGPAPPSAARGPSLSPALRRSQAALPESPPSRFPSGHCALSAPATHTAPSSPAARAPGVPRGGSPGWGRGGRGAPGPGPPGRNAARPAAARVSLSRRRREAGEGSRAAIGPPVRPLPRPPPGASASLAGPAHALGLAVCLGGGPCRPAKQAPGAWDPQGNLGARLRPAPASLTSFCNGSLFVGVRGGRRFRCLCFAFKN